MNRHSRLSYLVVFRRERSVASSSRRVSLYAHTQSYALGPATIESILHGLNLHSIEVETMQYRPDGSGMAK